MEKLDSNKELLKEFTDSYKKFAIKPSQYWDNYVSIILHEIEKDGLNGFGSVYNLTRGFGDAMSYPKRQRIRSILKIPFLYELIEKFLANRNQKKKSRTVFEASKDFFTQTNLIDEISLELDEVTKNLEINRYIEVNKKKVPWRYLQAFAYIELLVLMLNKDNHNLTIKELLDGNTMDIGGGYGPVIDILYYFKAINSIGSESINYQLEQYPVSFIANQYLDYRHKAKVLKPILDLDDNKMHSKNSDQSFRIIQSSVSNMIKSLDVRFFFNSNSFQEMSKEQVESYIKFIKNNKADTSYLACFYYNSGVGDTKKSQVWNSNKDALHASIDLFNTEFSLIDKIDFSMDGFVPGILFLFKLS